MKQHRSLSVEYDVVLQASINKGQLYAKNGADFVHQQDVIQQMNQALERNFESVQSQLNSQRLANDTLITNLSEAQMCYTAWKDRCQQVEERLASTNTRLQEYREWHNEK